MAEQVAAERAALRLVARAEQCTAGLVQKLELRKHKPEAIELAIARLVELDLVNDTRYAELWLKSRISRGNKGPRMLLAALQNRGIDRKTAQAALETVLTAEAESALLLRRLEKAPAKYQTNQERKLQTKLFLKAEGFSSAAIEEYIEEL